MEIKDDTLKILVREATSSQRKQLKMIIGLVTTLGLGGAASGGIYMTLTTQQLSDSSAAEEARDKRLTRNEEELKATSERVRYIAVLLIQQGRHFERIVRSMAPPGTQLPERPAALDDVEREVLR